jgi:hypothetical protein
VKGARNVLARSDWPDPGQSNRVITQPMLF